MSVDFYSCDCCEESRYEEYVGHCSKCGHSLCTSCLVNNDINSSYAYEYNVKFDGSEKQKEEYDIESKQESEYGYEIGDIIDDAGIDSKYCPFCTGNEIHNDDLLEFALKLLNIDRDTLITKYRDDNKK
ncbi:hypothetical protein [Clostridium sp. UBA4395]|uniref:hypothetical protein n=1 Tax=Clostridium sp. UBA4395 TaxID=1946360 RepID=UPI003216AB42